MKITDRTNPVTFESLDNGAAFKHEDIFYMKIKETYDCNYNAIRLFDGEMMDFDWQTYVAPCSCELIVG